MNVLTQIFDRFIGQVCIEILRCCSESISMKDSDLIMAFKCMTGQAFEYLTSQFITREQVSEQLGVAKS